MESSIRTKARLDGNGFISKGISGYGKDQEGTCLGAAAFIVSNAVFKRVQNIGMMVVTSDAEDKPRIFVQHIVEIFCNVVVKLFRARHGMHSHHGARNAGRYAVDVLPDKSEIGYRGGVVVFESVRVQTGKMDKACVEREVIIAIHAVVYVFAGAEAVVVTNDADPGHLEFAHDFFLPLKFFPQSEVGLVARVNNEIYIAPVVYGTHQLLCLIVPALCITDLRKADGVFPCAGSLNAPDHGLVLQDRSIGIGIIRVIFYQIAPVEQDGRNEEEYESDVAGHFLDD